MKIEKKNLDKARELLAELEKLEDSKDVLKNYDAEVYATFCTYHNHNAKLTKKVEISLPSNLIGEINKYISDRISKIEKELEKL